MGDTMSNSQSIKVDDKTESDIIDLYKQGYGTKAIVKKLGLPFSHYRTRKVLIDHDVPLRSRKESVRKSPNVKYIKLSKRVQNEIVRAYEEGETTRTISEKHGVSRQKIRNVLKDNGIKIRTMKEAQRLKAQKNKRRRQKTSLTPILDRLAKEEPAIRVRMEQEFSKQYRKYHSFMKKDEVIDSAMNYTPEIAAKWKPNQTSGDNFVWFVAHWSLRRHFDYVRQAYRKSLKAPTTSLNAPVYHNNDGSVLEQSYIIESREENPLQSLEWKDLKHYISNKIREYADRGDMPERCVDLLICNIIPKAEGAEFKTLKELSEKYNVSESVICQYKKHPQFVAFLEKHLKM